MSIKQGFTRSGFRSAVLIATILAGRALAQVADGNVVGSVFDPDQALIANARVEAENLATGVKTSATADATGHYRFNNLLVGSYKVTASAQGYQASSLNLVAVELSKTTTVNVTLQLATVNFAVDVVAAPSLLDTTTAQIGNNYPTRMASDLPIAANPSGGYVNLSLLGAGVASSGGVGGGTGPSIGGQRPRTNSFTIEGTDNNRKDVTGPVVSLPNDAVAEFTVLQNQFSAEFGHSAGGQFNAVIRGGSNEVHGRVYEYFQNRNLNAMDQAFRRQGISAVPRYDENLLGGNVGGPIARNKLFYFGNYDYNPIGRATTSAAPKFAPTAAGYAALEGKTAVSPTNLGVLKQYLGVAGKQDGTRTTTVQGTPIPLGQVAYLAPDYANYYRWLTSIDYNISERDQLRGRYANNRVDSIDNAAQLPAFYGTRPSRTHLLSLTEIHVFTPQLTNELRLGYNRVNNRVNAPAMVFPGLDSFPNISIRNDLGLNLGPNINAPQATTQNTYQVADNVTWVHGKHDLKFGFDGRDLISSMDFIQRVRGEYQYNTLEPYLLDITPDFSAQRTSGSKAYLGNTTQWYLYINDNWKITRKLTVNLGLRWEYNGIAKGMKDQALNSIADVPGVLTFRAPRAQKKNFAPRVGFAYSPGSKGNTVIRGGFGLGYDQIFDNIAANVRPPQATSTAYVFPDEGGPGFLANGGIRSSQRGDELDTNYARMLTSGYVPDQQLPYAINWNFGIQHVFAKDYVVDIRYVGTRGVHLLLQSMLNRQAVVTATHNLPTYLTKPSQAELDSLPLTLTGLRAERDAVGNTLKQYGFLSSIIAYQPQGNSIYHGLAIDVNKRFSHNLTFKAGYTWSHVRDDSTMEVNLTTLAPRRPQDFNNLRPEWASSLLDRRQRFTFTWIYDTPWFAQSSSWWLKNVLGNYSLSGVYTAESPQWVTPQSSLDANLNSDAVSDRAIINANGVPGTSTDVATLRNTAGQIVAYAANDPTAQFIRARDGAYANSGRNVLPTNGINNFDISVVKAFHAGERYRVELRADLFNALNHSQFTPGRTNNVLPTRHDGVSFYLVPGSPFFNKFDQIYPNNARWIQLVAKVHF